MTELLTCGKCHFLIVSKDATTAGQTVCRRHSKQVTLQLVDMKAPARTNGIELPPELQEQAGGLQTAFLQGQPMEFAGNVACGDFRLRNDGADYWTAWRRERAKMLKAAAAAVPEGTVVVGRDGKVKT